MNVMISKGKGNDVEYTWNHERVLENPEEKMKQQEAWRMEHMTPADEEACKEHPKCCGPFPEDVPEEEKCS